MCGTTQVRTCLASFVCCIVQVRADLTTSPQGSAGSPAEQLSYLSYRTPPFGCSPFQPICPCQVFPALSSGLQRTPAGKTEATGEHHFERPQQSPGWSPKFRLWAIKQVTCPFSKQCGSLSTKTWFTVSSRVKKGTEGQRKLARECKVPRFVIQIVRP